MAVLLTWILLLALIATPNAEFHEYCARCDVPQYNILCCFALEKCCRTTTTAAPIRPVQTPPEIQAALDSSPMNDFLTTAADVTPTPNVVQDAENSTNAVSAIDTESNVNGTEIEGVGGGNNASAANSSSVNFESFTDSLDIFDITTTTVGNMSDDVNSTNSTTVEGDNGMLNLDLNNKSEEANNTFDEMNSPFDAINSTAMFDRTNSTVSFDVINTTNTFDGVNSTWLFGKMNSTDTFDGMNSTGSFDKLNITDMFAGINHTDTFVEINSTNTFGEKNSTGSFDKLNSTDMFDGLNSTDTSTNSAIADTDIIFADPNNATAQMNSTTPSVNNTNPFRDMNDTFPSIPIMFSGENTTEFTSSKTASLDSNENVISDANVTNDDVSLLVSDKNATGPNVINETYIDVTKDLANSTLKSSDLNRPNVTTRNESEVVANPSSTEANVGNFTTATMEMTSRPPLFKGNATKFIEINKSSESNNTAVSDEMLSDAPMEEIGNKSAEETSTNSSSDKRNKTDDSILANSPTNGSAQVGNNKETTNQTDLDVTTTTKAQGKPTVTTTSIPLVNSTQVPEIENVNVTSAGQRENATMQQQFSANITEVTRQRQSKVATTPTSVNKSDILQVDEFTTTLANLERDDSESIRDSIKMMFPMSFDPFADSEAEDDE